jgi:hypothetical protein
MSEGSSKGNLAELGEQLKQVLERVQDAVECFRQYRCPKYTW